MQHTFEPPALSWVGPGELDLDDAPDRMVADLNVSLRRAAPSYVYWLDVAALAAQVGHRNWTDLRLYYHGKFGVSPRAITAYGSAFLGLFRALWGRSRKCLIVDLDNTLWGGVVGDDGMEGILLGPDTPAGEAHHAFCAYLLGLKRRGVILAVCSKNDERSAREVFEKHPHMPLHLEDIAAFRCNWDDKPGNIEAIARELNIDLSHVAFFDDNPAECEFVRTRLPQVYVLQAPADPAMLVWTIDDAHLFDMVKVSAEDRLRASSYAGRKAAEDMRSLSASVGDYLEHLAMKAVCKPASPADTARLAQMEKKTNQFNFTTRRYDETVIGSLMSREDVTVLACRLTDRFADHGLVASMILIREGDAMRIDSWLMSCRVFARTLEHFMMRKALGVAREAGVRRIVGEYVPTEKNGVVQSLFPSLGFTRDPDGKERATWSRELGIAASEMHTFVADADAPPAEGVPASR
ncbi:MAG: HAD-IIIC family phosphatase [bacterium]